MIGRQHRAAGLGAQPHGDRRLKRGAVLEAAHHQRAKHGRASFRHGDQYALAAAERLHIAPLVVVLPNIAHFDLELRGVGGHIGQHAPLKGLEHHVALDPADAHARPEGVGGGVADGKQPVENELVANQAVIFKHGAARVQEIPEGAWNAEAALDMRDLGGGRVRVLREIVRAFGQKLAGDVAAQRAAKRRAVDADQAGVGREGIARVAGQRDIRRCQRDEIAQAGLHLPLDQLVHQQAVGYKPGRAGVAVRVVDLHPALVEVLHRAAAALALGKCLA